MAWGPYFSSPELASPLFFVVVLFWGFPLFSTHQARTVFFCWGPNSSQVFGLTFRVEDFSSVGTLCESHERGLETTETWDAGMKLRLIISICAVKRSLGMTGDGHEWGLRITRVPMKEP